MNEPRRNASKPTDTGAESVDAVVTPGVVREACTTAAAIAPDRISGATSRALIGRSRLAKAAVALLPPVAVAVGASIALSGDRHPVPGSSRSASASASTRSHPNAARHDSRGVTVPTRLGGGAAPRTDCVVTITNATICGASAAQYCNLVISRALPEGPAATRRCVSQIRQFNRERSRAYELDEESSEPMQAGGAHG